jgi:hypothetical protein
MVVVALIVILFGLLVGVSVMSLVNTYLPRPPGGKAADRLMPYRRSAVADEAQRWLSDQ